MAEETKTIACLSEFETPISPGIFPVTITAPREILKSEKGNTIYFEQIFRHQDGSLSDPGSASWQITNIKGAIVTQGGLMKRSIGYWYFFWTPDTTGDYILKITGYFSGYPVIFRRKIKIIETSA